MRPLRKLLLICLILAIGVQTHSVRAQSSAAAGVSLLATASATGPQVMWPGGAGVFAVVGTWNGATVTLQFMGPDGTTLVTAGTATTLTANGAGVFYLPRGLIQATITGAGGSTSLTATAKPVINFIG